MNESNKQKELLRIAKLKKEAANQYVKETENEMPSINNSEVTESNKTEIVVLRDKQNRFIANYQLLKDFIFHRLDEK